MASIRAQFNSSETSNNSNPINQCDSQVVGGPSQQPIHTGGYKESKQQSSVTLAGLQ
ncbi:MAG: hypothetical protein K2X77_25730 [Candidatus Obscuribacterales bacterium]|nr:hypothetical protein [Candidatus Obscuribacterales bacterium]